jgi:hypothetical protein
VTGVTTARGPGAPGGVAPAVGRTQETAGTADGAAVGGAAPGPSRVVVRAGNYQSARVDRPFNAQLTAWVVDDAGRPARGVRVTFTVTSGPATFAHGARATTSTTGGGGVATAQVLTAGARTGTVRILATAGVASRPAHFSLRVLPGTPRGGRPLRR